MIYLLPFIINIAITPIIRRFALRRGFTDKVDGDPLKIHKKPVALLGGVAIITAYIVGLGVLVYIPQYPAVHSKMQFMGIIIGGMLVFGVGLWDDLKGAQPIIRLLVQVLAGIIILLSGITVNFIPIAVVAIPLTLFYIAGAINAFNVTDGMDGLCAGISLVACIGFFFLGLKASNTILVILSSILFMSLLGFLPYNFHSAKIFLGDAGSGFLGFMLGIMAVMATSKPFNFINFIAPILIISVPVFDMAFAILRRLIRKRPLFLGDRNHVYDLLLKKRCTQPEVWGIMCGIQTVMVGIALIIVYSTP